MRRRTEVTPRQATCKAKAVRRIKSSYVAALVKRNGHVADRAAFTGKLYMATPTSFHSGKASSRGTAYVLLLAPADVSVTSFIPLDTSYAFLITCTMS